MLEICFKINLSSAFSQHMHSGRVVLICADCFVLCSLNIYYILIDNFVNCL
jgi:hypothetical protein